LGPKRLRTARGFSRLFLKQRIDAAEDFSSHDSVNSQQELGPPNADSRRFVAPHQYKFHSNFELRAHIPAVGARIARSVAPIAA
jgi:hypothetical protein